jgi:hypothetical protein
LPAAGEATAATAANLLRSTRPLVVMLALPLPLPLGLLRGEAGTSPGAEAETEANDAGLLVLPLSPVGVWAVLNIFM